MNKRLYAVAGDPGGTTGAAVVSVPRDTVFGKAPYAGIRIEDYLHLSGSEPEMAGALAELWLLYKQIAGERVPLILERFSLRVMSRDERMLSPVRITALIKERVPVLDSAGRAQVFFQDVGEAKRVVSNARLKAWGIEAPLIGGEDHARDALRHDVLFLRRAAQSRSLRQEAWDVPPGEAEARH